MLEKCTFRRFWQIKYNMEYAGKKFMFFGTVKFWFYFQLYSVIICLSLNVVGNTVSVKQSLMKNVLKLWSKKWVPNWANSFLHILLKAYNLQQLIWVYNYAEENKNILLKLV